MSKFNHTIYLETRELCLEVNCVLNYQPAGGDGWNEPRYPEEAELLSAKIGEVDICKSLDKEQVAQIEADALVRQGEQCREDAAERAFERSTGAY